MKDEIEECIKQLTGKIKKFDNSLFICSGDWEEIFFLIVMDKTRKGLIRLEVSETGEIEIKEDYLEGNLTAIRGIISAM